MALCILILFLGSNLQMVYAEEKCVEVLKNLEQSTLRLKEYVSALQIAHRERNFHMVTLLHSEIDETLKQIRVGEAELLNCPSTAGGSGPGLSSVKSSDTQFAEMNCDDLKKKHIQMLRKYNSLARRRQSVLSELTNEEKVEFREAEDSITAVESELKKRCQPARAPKPFQRGPKPAR